MSNQAISEQAALDTEVAVKHVSLLESDLPKILATGYLSSKTRFSLHISGPFEDRERELLMKMLGVQVLGDRPDRHRGSEPKFATVG